MKILILFLYIVLISFTHSRRRNIEDVKSEIVLSDRNSMEKWINKFNVKSDILVSNKNEVNLSSAIEDAEFQNKNEFIFPKRLNWIEVKKNLGEAKNLMGKFLVLRLDDLKRMIRIALSEYPFEKCHRNEDIEIVGTLSKFNVTCIKYVYGSERLQGSFSFSAGGSASFTSDIDLNADFQPHANEISKSSKLTNYRITGEFIEKYHLKFEQIHENSSAEAYDVNLYSLNFGKLEILALVKVLKNYNAKDYDRFLYANRLAGLLILYNDAYHLALKKRNSEIRNLKGITTRDENAGSDMFGLNINYVHSKLIELYNLSNDPEDSSKNCGQQIIAKKGLLFNDRSNKDKERNHDMVKHLKKSDFGALSNILCNIVAGNYYALEAYSSVGSIIDIMDLQQLLNSKDTEKFNIVDENFYVDAIIMNFAYGVEHFYQFSGEDESFKKFGKYMSRILRLVFQLKEKPHKECWDTAFKNLIGNDLEEYKIIARSRVLNLQNVKKLAEQIEEKTKYSKINSNNNKSKKHEKINQFLKQGFNCINNFGFKLTKVNHQKYYDENLPNEFYNDY